jgi:hypothetical protein
MFLLLSFSEDGFTFWYDYFSLRDLVGYAVVYLTFFRLLFED